jgi:hypothetical protein
MALTDNLQAFYKLSDTSDSSGYNRTLTNNGNVTFAPGKIGDAAVFNQGSLSRNASFLANVSELTISAWYKNSENGPIFSIWGNGSNDFSIVSNGWGNGTSIGMAFFTNAGGGFYNFPEGTGILDDGQYHHVVMVYSSSNSSFKAFVDGNQIFSESITGQLCTSESLSLLVLGSEANRVDAFSSSIDAFGIWNRALSDAEVAELYNNGTGLELDGVPQPTLVKLQAPVKFMGKVKFGV